MPPSTPLNESPPTSNRTALVILLGFPFVAVLALDLHGIFYAFGYRYVPGRIPIASLIGIAIGTQFGYWISGILVSTFAAPLVCFRGCLRLACVGIGSAASSPSAA